MSQERVPKWSKAWAKFGRPMLYIQEMVLQCEDESSKAYMAAIIFKEAIRLRRRDVARWLIPYLNPDFAWCYPGAAASVDWNDLCREFVLAMPPSDPALLDVYKDAPLHELQRPPECEVSATRFALHMIEKYDLTGKLCNYSVKDGLPLILAARAKGLRVTCEVTKSQPKNSLRAHHQR